MTTFNWAITQMERKSLDGFVVTVYYTVNAADGDYSARNGGGVNFKQQPDESYTPYDQLTEQQVLGWVQEAVGKDATEANLQAQIDLQKAPVCTYGMPWATPAA